MYIYIYILLLYFIMVYVMRQSNVCATWRLCRSFLASSVATPVRQLSAKTSIPLPWHRMQWRCYAFNKSKALPGLEIQSWKNYEDPENLKGPVMYSRPCNGLRPAFFDTDWFDFMALSSDFGVDSDARGAPAHSLGRSSSSKMKFVDRCLAAISNNFSGG